jgi:hypothetical protein
MLCRPEVWPCMRRGMSRVRCDGLLSAPAFGLWDIDYATIQVDVFTTNAQDLHHSHGRIEANRV